MRVHSTRTRFRTPSVSAMVAMTVVVVVLLAPAHLLAAIDHNVTVGANGSNKFNPDKLNISWADTVKFIWEGSHTLTRMENGTSCVKFSGPEDKGKIDTADQKEGYVYVVYPTAPGKAYFACVDHCEDGMKFALTVYQDNQPKATPTPQPVPPPDSGGEEDKNDLPLILGSVCGGLGLIIVAIGAFWFVRRTRRREKKRRLQDQSLVQPHSPAGYTTSTGFTPSTGTSSVGGYSPAMTQQPSPHVSTGATLSTYFPQPGPPPSPGPPSPSNPVFNFLPQNTYPETNQTVFTEGGANEVVVVPFTGQPAGPPGTQ